jgi:hypothetical protein
MKRGYGCLITNLLTGVVVLATAAACAVTVMMFANPYNAFNPFPPPTLPSIAVLPSPTTTDAVSNFPTFPPTFTHTSTITLTPTITNTPRPVTATNTRPPATDTPESSPTPSATEDLTQQAQLTENVATNTLAPTLTATVTPTASKTRSAFPFTVQGGAPLPIQNFANSEGCNWMGIAGQAFDLQGNPIINLVVHLEGGGVELDAVTGTKTAYGAGGYEFFLNNRPVQSSGEFEIQLLDPSGKIPYSDLIIVDTYADCSKNLLLVNFVQNH